MAHHVEIVDRSSVPDISKRDLETGDIYVIDREDGKFQNLKTPKYEADGALREGGAPNLFSRDYIGVIVQYAAVGLIFGTLPGTIYPFLQKYLNMQGNQTITALTLVEMPWSFKIFYGIVTDCFPIFGYRRRPYIMIGWSLGALMLLIMACTPVGDPYYTNPKYRTVKPKDYTSEIIASFNTSAQDKGGKYVILMMLAAFGYLMAVVASDAVVVELAQREPIAIRGRTQTIIYAVRTVFAIIAKLVMAFAFNGVDYGGRFDWSLSFPTLMLLLAMCLIPVIPITWFFIKEEKIERCNLGSYMGELWTALKSRAFFQVIAYKFFSGVFDNFTWVGINPVQDYWAHVTPLNDKISAVIGDLFFMTALVITGKYGLGWSWRMVPIVTVIIMIVLDSIGTMFTVWGVVRNQWFWLSFSMIQRLPKGVIFIVSTYIIVELAGVGNEGAVYGLLTTVSNLTRPFAYTISKNVDSIMDFSTERIKSDTTAIRTDVTISIMIMYGAKLLALGFLIMLPRQKAEVQALKRSGQSSSLLGGLTVFYLTFALIWSVTTNILGIFKSTACLKIAGGNGCK